MAARAPEAGDLRARRTLFQRALREGVSMDEARRRQAAERWAITDARLHAKRNGEEDAAEAPRAWWLRD